MRIGLKLSFDVRVQRRQTPYSKARCTGFILPPNNCPWIMHLTTDNRPQRGPIRHTQFGPISTLFGLVFRVVRVGIWANRCQIMLTTHFVIPKLNIPRICSDRPQSYSPPVHWIQPLPIGDRSPSWDPKCKVDQRPKIKYPKIKDQRLLWNNNHVLLTHHDL